MLTRRLCLKGAAALLTLPPLEALAPRGAEPDVCAAWLYFPNGVAEGSWGAASVKGGRIEALEAPMAPLARHLDRLSLVRGVVLPGSSGHGGGTATWLTGGHWDDRELDAAGPSVDQVAARAFARGHVIPALSLSTRGAGFFAADVARNNISWSAPGRPVFRMADARAAFEALFGASPEADRSRLDGLRDQLAALRSRVSAADAECLDAYAEAIRSIERRVAFVGRPEVRERLERTEALGFPFGPGAPPPSRPADHGQALDLLLDVTALALWSGASRVATVMLDHGQSNRYADFIPGVKGTWHALSHWRDASGRTEDDDGVTRWRSTRSKREMYDAVVTWHHERVARFLDRLAALPEAGGRRLIDRSLVVYGSNLADGHEHGAEDLPTLIAGGANGRHPGRRMLGSRRGTSMSRVHLAALHALGIDADDFAGEDEPLALTGRS